MARWLPIGLLVFALTLIGCTGGNTPKKGGVPNKEGQAEQDGPKEKSVDKPATVKADLVITYEAMAKELDADAEAANAKFRQATRVEVTGAINNTLPGVVYLGGIKDKKGEPIWVKGSVKRDYEGNRDMLDQKSRKFLGLSKGQKVKVVGTYIFFRNGEVWLENCVLTELEPSAQKTVSAENLTTEFEKDEKAATARYSGEDVLVSGTILQISSESLKLMGTKITEFEVQVGESEMKANGKNLKAGQTVEVRGSNARLVRIVDTAIVVVSNGYIVSAK